MSTLTVLRRLFVLAVSGLWLGVASVTLASPAAADVPEFWPSDVEVNNFHALLVIVLIPLALALVITFLVYAPSIIRGERITPGPAPVENQWLGGPRKSAGELAAPDDADSQAGGASGRW